MYAIRSYYGTAGAVDPALNASGFEMGVDLLVDANQLTVRFEIAHALLEIAVAHAGPLSPDAAECGTKRQFYRKQHGHDNRRFHLRPQQTRNLFGSFNRQPSAVGEMLAAEPYVGSGERNNFV